MNIGSNFKVSFDVIDTDYEPPNTEYAEMFSWQGNEFPKRPKQREFTVHRQKRSSKIVQKSGEDTKVPDEGVLVIVESLSVINAYLHGSPRDPFRVSRRIFVIAILSAKEPEFYKLIKRFQRKLWLEYRIADTIIITPCTGDPEVSCTVI